MQKNKLYLFTLINLVLLIGVIVFLLFDKIDVSNKIVCVDNVRLFDGFQMTKEMKAIGEKEFAAKKANLDGLYEKLQYSTDEKEKEVLMQNFIKSREEFDQFNQEFAVEETGKIWSRISSYTKVFSEENNYKIVIGSNGRQDVLYADEAVDVTNELLAYINKKYAGL